MTTAHRYKIASFTFAALWLTTIVVFGEARGMRVGPFLLSCVFFSGALTCGVLGRQQ